MQTAVAAGMYPVGALWGFRTREELLACGAKTLISRPMELMKTSDRGCTGSLEMSVFQGLSEGKTCMPVRSRL
jgi:hypothetical protein